ncbi:MAG: hypothetical protein IPO45_16845 [Saprospiraceae bacterium]|nr:hypothetical protein [Candidatus Brachybacter algidus]
MAIIANILLFIASICIVGLNTGALSKPSPTGDAGVGYVWTLLMINIVFCIAMIIVAIITNSKGGYNWVPGSWHIQNSFSDRRCPFCINNIHYRLTI